VGAGKITAVADAGPLIHLFEIDCLPILSIFDSLHIPEAVWSEVVGSERIPLRQLHEVSTPFVTKAIVEIAIEQLHKFERKE